MVDVADQPANPRVLAALLNAGRHRATTRVRVNDKPKSGWHLADQLDAELSRQDKSSPNGCWAAALPSICMR
jgi:hypothetical protein